MGMRVTNKMLIDTSLRDMGLNSGRVAKWQEQMGSQRRMNRLSDDPLGLITSLRARSRMYTMERHQGNLDSADAWLTGVETNLMEINKLMTTMYEDSINAATDVKNESDRVAIAQKVREFRDQLLQTGNNSLSDKYLFGGYNATRPPFSIENGMLYYNGYNMYSSTTRELNVETAIADMMNALEGAANASAGGNAEDVRNDVEAARSAADQILQAVLQVTGTRSFPDGQGSTRPASEQDMLDAAQGAFDYFSVKNGWTTAQQDAARQVITTLQNAYNAEADVDQLETMAKTMSSAMQNTVDELSSKLRTNPAVATADEAKQYMADQSEYADAAANMAETAAKPATDGKGIEFEGDRKYEIEIGLGQYMNVTMNGVEVFGTGEKNLYKILDDLYNALTKEYNDTSYGNQAYATNAVDSIDSYVQNANLAIDVGAVVADIDDFVQGLTDPAANPAVDIPAAKDAVTEIGMLLSQVADAGLGAANAADAQTAMAAVIAAGNAANGGAAWSADAQAAANALMGQVTDADTAGMTKAQIDMGLREAKGAVNATVGAITAGGAATIADMKLISSGQAAAYGPPATAADIAATAADIADAISRVVDVGLNHQGSSPEALIQSMKDAVQDGWSQPAKDAAEALIQQVEYAKDGDMSVDDIKSGLVAAKEAANTAAAAITAAPGGTVADMQAASTAQKADYDNQLRFSTSGKKTGSVADDITPFIGRLQGAQKDTMAQMAIIGGRTNRIDIVRERYNLDEINYTDRISRVEDADLSEVIMRLKMAESVYNASLSSSARIIQPTLMDFLR